MGAVLGDVLYKVCSPSREERLAQDYLDLRQMTDSVIEITKMFTQRALFSPDFAALV